MDERLQGRITTVEIHGKNDELFDIEIEFEDFLREYRIINIYNKNNLRKLSLKKCIENDIYLYLPMQTVQIISGVYPNLLFLNQGLIIETEIINTKKRKEVSV